MRKMPKRSCRTARLFTIKAQSSTLKMQPGESQEASFWGMSVEIGGRMHQIISIQTGLLHDSGVCECFAAVC